MELKLVEFTESYAKEICNWKYDGEYSIYNYPEWNLALNSQLSYIALCGIYVKGLRMSV